MKKKEYKEPKMRVIELESTDILAGSFESGNGAATQSLDDNGNEPSDNGFFRNSVIFD